MNKNFLWILNKAYGALRSEIYKEFDNRLENDNINEGKQIAN